MTRTARLLMTLGVAAAAPAASLVLAQVEKAADATAFEKKKEEVTTKVEAKPAAVKKQARAAVRVLANPAMNTVEGIIQQFLPQTRPIMRAEVHLVRTVCDPTEEQRAAIAREGERVLQDATREYAEAYHKMQQGQWNGTTAPPDMPKRIAEGIVEAVKAHLTPEQAARYRAEVDRRAERTKATAVNNLVAGLDEELLLSADQRAGLAESLSAHWDPAWCRRNDFFMYGGAYFPSIPDKLIVPHLGETQKKEWAARQKLQYGVSWGFSNFLGNGLAIEEPDDAPGQPAAKTVEVRKEAKP